MKNPKPGMFNPKNPPGFLVSGFPGTDAETKAAELPCYFRTNNN